MLFLTSHLSDILQLLTHPSGEYRVIIICVSGPTLPVLWIVYWTLNSHFFHLSTERTGELYYHLHRLKCKADSSFHILLIETASSLYRIF